MADGNGPAGIHARWKRRDQRGLGGDAALLKDGEVFLVMGNEDVAAIQAYLQATKNRIKDVYDKTHPRA